MATVTGMTAAAMQAIRDGTVVSAAFDSANHLILTKYDATQIDAGTLSAATTAHSGPVELATSAETQTGTDTDRAVTPAGLASLPGYRVQIVSGIAESAVPTAYPSGTSLMDASGWSLGSGFGTVVTQNVSMYRCVQTFYSAAGGSSFPQAWVRHHNTSDGGGGWTAWESIMIGNTLAPGSFTQTTAFTSYPEGDSRLYYTTANSSAWDFAGKAAEVRTYRNGSDFARQTWSKHVGGANFTETWVRTANAASGWTPWVVQFEDSGWQSLTMNGGASYTVRRALFWRRKNGVVYLSGAVSVPTGGYTPFATLPVEARPSADKILAVSTNASGITMSCIVNQSTGFVNSWLNSASTAWFSLEGMSWPMG